MSSEVHCRMQGNQGPEFLEKLLKGSVHSGIMKHGKVTAFVENGEMTDTNSDNKDMDTCKQI